MVLSILPTHINGQSSDSGQTNRPVKPEPLFEIRGFVLQGNTVLPPEKFGFLSNYTGKAVSLGRMRQGLSELQLLYRDLGFPTVTVSLPQQRLTNGVVQVKVFEGRLADIVVVGNRYYSSNNIRRSLPSLETNVLINTKWFQPELDKANANPDRQIYPVIGPGPDPGSSALTLRVKDRLPLHGHVELDNKSTPGTPLFRIDSALQYNNLWQHDHQLGLQYNFSPEDQKPSEARAPFYDSPNVASYSAFYRIPLAFSTSLRETYDQQPVDFGYNQVTHRFNLPPLTGAPEFIAFASRSTTDTGARPGPIVPITDTATLNVFDQTFERNPVTTADLGSRFIVPLTSSPKLQSSLNFGFDYKSYQAAALVTNFTTVLQFTTNPPTLINSGVVTNAQNTYHSLHYLPLTLGWSGTFSDKVGTTTLTYNQNVFLSALSSPRSVFQQVAGASSAGGNYTTINLGVVREQQLPRGWSLLARAGGQWSSTALINNEEFPLGGTSGVRGYQEGETYGDTGWRTQFDLRAPAFDVGYFPQGTREIPASLRCSLFMDYGQAFHLQPSSGSTQQWGTGVGFYYTAGQHVDARLTLGWALLSTPLTRAGDARAYFSVGFQF